MAEDYSDNYSNFFDDGGEEYDGLIDQISEFYTTLIGGAYEMVINKMLRKGYTNMDVSFYPSLEGVVRFEGELFEPCLCRVNTKERENVSGYYFQYNIN